MIERLASIETIIGHMECAKRLERNRIKATIGNAITAFLSAAAMNFGNLLR